MRQVAHRRFGSFQFIGQELRLHRSDDQVFVGLPQLLEIEVIFGCAQDLGLAHPLLPDRDRILALQGLDFPSVRRILAHMDLFFSRQVGIFTQARRFFAA